MISQSVILSNSMIKVKMDGEVIYYISKDDILALTFHYKLYCLPYSVSLSIIGMSHEI